MGDIVSVMKERGRVRRLLTAVWSGAVAMCAFANVHLAAAVQRGEVDGLSSIPSALTPAPGPILVILGAILAWAGLYALAAWCNRFVPQVDEWENDVTNDRRFPSWNMVESLSKSLGIPSPIIVHDRMSWYEAAAFRLHGFRKISLSRNLLLDADYDEMEAVIAHELSHIYRNDHLLLGVNQACVAGSVVAFGWATVAAAMHVDGLAGMAVAMALGAMIAFAAVLCMFAAMRSQEYTADMDSAAMTGNPEALMDYLGYLGRLAPSRSMSPFRTHPTAEQRIAALQVWTRPSTRQEAMGSR